MVLASDSAQRASVSSAEIKKQAQEGKRFYGLRQGMGMIRVKKDWAVAFLPAPSSLKMDWGFAALIESIKYLIYSHHHFDHA